MRRTVMALWRRDMLMLLRSPVYVMYLVVPVAAAWLFETFIVDGDRWAHAFAVLLGGLFSVAMACTLPGIYVQVEERERHVPETLLRAGVPAWTTVASKFAASVCWGVALAALSLLVLGVDVGPAGPLLAALLPAVVTVSAASVACGTLLRSQSSTSGPSAVIVVVLLFGVMSPMDRSLAMVSQFLPANLFVGRVMEMYTTWPPTLGDAVSAAVALAWMAAALWFLWWASRRFGTVLRSVVAGQPPEQQRERDGAHDDPRGGDRDRQHGLGAEQRPLGQ